MVYVLSTSKDPITASTRIPKFAKWPANNLANSASFQPYQKSFGYKSYLPLITGYNKGRNNMACCNWNSGTVNFFMPASSCGNFGNRTLFNINFAGTACAGGCGGGYSNVNVFPNINMCSGYGGYGGYAMMGGYPMMDAMYSPFSGLYSFMPMIGGGSMSNGFSNVSYSPYGFASTNPFGSQVYSLDSHKSSNYNFGALGSYAKSGSNSAWNILGLVSQTKSGGHKSLDASNLINTILFNA